MKISRTIYTQDEVLEACQKPPLKTVGNLYLTSEDFIIVCGGFEPRAVAALDAALVTSNSFNVLIIRYAPTIAANKFDFVEEKCSARSFTASSVLYDRQQPSGIGRVVLDRLSRCRGRIFVDISGMSRLLIVQLLVALGTRPQGFDQCSIVYTEAAHYPPTEQEALLKLKQSENDPTFSLLCLSSDIFEITIPPELSSFAIAGSQTRLISFPSFDPQHLTALKVELQPSRFSFIEGVPSSPSNKWRMGVIAEINRLQEMQHAERLETSTLDYRETLQCLIKLYQRHSIRDRLLIAPTGSKMQSVAVGIFRSFIHDVQIVYPTPHGFKSPEDYTQGAGPMHNLDLNSLALRNPADNRQDATA